MWTAPTSFFWVTIPSRSDSASGYFTRVQAYTAGYEREVGHIPHLSTALGGQLTWYGVPDVLSRSTAAPGGRDFVPASADTLKADGTNRVGPDALVRVGERSSPGFFAHSGSCGASLRRADEGVRPYVCLIRLTIIAIVLWAASAAPSCQPIM